jgi:uncharacterized damage-inducible protein DinB
MCVLFMRPDVPSMCRYTGGGKHLVHAQVVADLRGSPRVCLITVDRSAQPRKAFARLERMCQGVAVAEGSERETVPERWNAVGAGSNMWMDMALDPRFATGTEPEGERATLLYFLRRYRLAMELKCADLDAAQLASRSVPPSTMSLLGLIRHMADVERHWFRRVMAQSDAPFLYWSEGVPDAEWLGAAADPAAVDDAWRAWRNEVAFAEKFVADSPDLGVKGFDEQGASVALRSVLVHMIEEYARHCGHADLLRERIDGRVGQ